MKIYKFIFHIKAKNETEEKEKFNEDYNCDLDSGDHFYEVFIEEVKKPKKDKYKQ